MGWIYEFDLALAEAAHRLLTACGDWMTPLFKIITLSGNGGAVFILLSLLFLVFRKTRRLGALALIGLVVGAFLTNLLLKNLVARPRPFADPDSVFYAYWTAAGSLPEGEWSFPSGHTTAAMAFAFALFLNGNKKYSWLAFGIPLVMGFTRIYFGVHFATDILGGLVAGGIGGVSSWFILKALMRLKVVRTFLSDENQSSASSQSSNR